jgi:uncharacterized protein (TIGR02594 family)
MRLFCALAFVVLIALPVPASFARGVAFTAAPFPSERRVVADDEGRVFRGARTLVAIAESHLGQGNFIGLAGPWCADFVSAILRAAGKRPLANRTAASALAYGPREQNAQPGDLVVVRTRRGAYGHVGIVVADRGEDTVEIISGNWSHRVLRARILRRDVTAFVRV